MRGVADIDANVDNAGNGLDRLAHVADERRVIGGAEHQREAHFSIDRRRDVTHHFGGQDVGAGSRIFHGREGRGDFFLKSHGWMIVGSTELCVGSLAATGRGSAAALVRPEDGGCGVLVTIR